MYLYYKQIPHFKSGKDVYSEGGLYYIFSFGLVFLVYPQFISFKHLCSEAQQCIISTNMENICLLTH